MRMLGATPTTDLGQDDLVPLAQPYLNNRELELVGEVLRSGRLSLGPMRSRFERAFAELVGAEHAVAVSSGTAALHVAALTAGWGPGDEVVMSPLALAAAANVARSTGASVRFADVGMDGAGLDPAAVAAALTARTRGIVAVDAFGWPARIAPLHDLAQGRGITLVEDAGEALGARRAGGPIAAGAPWASVFAFSANKPVTTGEGGMVVTDDAALAARWRALVDQQPVGDVAGAVAMEPFGVNVRLSDVASAVGLGQLEKLPQSLAMREHVAAEYTRRLRRVEGIETPRHEAGGDSRSWGMYCVLLDDAVERDLVVVRLAQQGIECAAPLPSLPEHPMYGELGVSAGMFPVAEALARRTLALPCYPQLSPGQQRRIIEALVEAVAAG